MPKTLADALSLESISSIQLDDSATAKKIDSIHSSRTTIIINPLRLSYADNDCVQDDDQIVTEDADDFNVSDHVIALSDSDNDFDDKNVDDFVDQSSEEPRTRLVAIIAYMYFWIYLLPTCLSQMPISRVRISLSPVQTGICTRDT